jgi:hypothetical protein
MPTATLTNGECKRRALLAADWFVNTQVVQTRPQWDANHGRAIYTCHLPTGFRVDGLSWSQGRAIMCLISAWQITGKPVYLDAAIRAGDYLRYALQARDSRFPRSFGSFREETPTSRFCYPRDGIEGAFGLLQLFVLTGEGDYLDCCRAFADWYLKFGYDPANRWIHGRVGFDDDNDPFPPCSFQAGGAPFLWHYYQLTGDRRCLKMARLLADGMLTRFIDPASGAIIANDGGHHSGKVAGRAVVFNDDGSSIALTIAHVASGKSASKYLDAAVRYGDWLVEQCPRPLAHFAATGIQAVFLTELAVLTGQGRYADFARKLMADQVKLQVVDPKKPLGHGGFRGEDEPAAGYVAGANGRDFVTTRTTAYSALALFRLAGRSLGPSYSALGLEELIIAAKKRAKK